MRRMALDWILSRRQRVDFRGHPRCRSSTLKKDGFGTCRHGVVVTHADS